MAVFRRVRSAFGAYLRDQRLLANMSQRKVANRIGISTVHYADVERGTRGPIAEKHWQKLCDAVPGIEIHQLEATAARSRTIKIFMTGKSMEYVELIYLFYKRVEAGDLSADTIRELMVILSDATKQG